MVAIQPLENHVIHLLVHGTLHLLGYDHEKPSDGDLMEDIEIAILNELGIANPYELSAGPDETNDGKG